MFIDSFKRKMEGIDFVFSQSPELASIGTKTQYMQYLSTIFKTSKVKDIVYHGASKDFQGFIKNKKIIPKGKTKGGIWFTDFANADWVYKEEEGKVIAALINLKNPIEYKTERYFDDEYGDYLNSKPLKRTWIINRCLLLDIFETSGDIGVRNNK
jgi:hypothetical protein